MPLGELQRRMSSAEFTLHIALDVLESEAMQAPQDDGPEQLVWCGED